MAAEKNNIELMKDTAQEHHARMYDQSYHIDELSFNTCHRVNVYIIGTLFNAINKNL